MYFIHLIRNKIMFSSVNNKRILFLIDLIYLKLVSSFSLKQKIINLEDPYLAP
jgi:hypothetical protein